MKKLLGALSALTLTVSSSGVVVACGSERIKTPTLNPELARQILVKITGDNAYANYDFGKIFQGQDLTTVVVRMINDLIAKQYSFDSTNYHLKNLKGFDTYTTNQDGTIEDKFSILYEQKSRSIAQDNLFNEYITSISNNALLDYKNISSLYTLNVYKDTTILGMDNNEYKIKAETPIKFTQGGKTAQWEVYGENKHPSFTPTIETLTKEFSDGESVFTVDAIDKTNVNISAKTALYLRFQDYFENKLMADISSNLLTMSYLDATMFNYSTVRDSETGYEPFLNLANPIFNETQENWKVSNEVDWKTNVKMVWSIRIKDSVQSRQAIEELMSNSNTIITSMIDSTTGALKNPETTSIKKLFEEISSSLKSYIDYGDKLSYDPYLGQQGFKGFTIYKNGTAIGTSPIDGEAYVENVKNWEYGPGIVKVGTTEGHYSMWTTTNASNSAYRDLTIVLPIYMIELLGGSATTEQQIKEQVYTINGAGENQSVKVNFGRSFESKEKLREAWNNENNKKKHSADVQEFASNDQVQQAILNQIQYSISTSDKHSTTAKEVLYTQYLDADDVYYAGLWEQIGQYIKSENDYDD